MADGVLWVKRTFRSASSGAKSGRDGPSGEGPVPQTVAARKL